MPDTPDLQKARHRADAAKQQPAPHGPRHRGETMEDPANTEQLRKLGVPAKPSGRRVTGAVGMAATGGLLILGLSAVGQQRTDSTEPPPLTEPIELVPEGITAAADAGVPAARVQVSSVPSPAAPPAPAAAPPAARPAAPAAPVPPPAPRPGVIAPPAPAQPAPAPVAAPPAGKGPAIANAALAQLGRIQDCTRLVSNALAAVGISFHGWPAGYLTLGRQITAEQAAPGDLLYYLNGGGGVPHIAVYIGGGMAVHGGWNGNQTVKFSAYVGSGPVFIRV